eukprot:GILJ01010637.1.p1 GENE.GILJ01010637.1~~GILJ01010637.1.p1  ORF type:complete len:308 (-),score=14.20 GILJ01010637.1:388-1311(-)
MSIVVPKSVKMASHLDLALAILSKLDLLKGKQANTCPCGYQRGHQVPAKAMAFSASALCATFQRTNQLCQLSSTNVGSWGVFERFARHLVWMNFEAELKVYVGPFDSECTREPDSTPDNVNGAPTVIFDYLYMIIHCEGEECWFPKEGGFTIAVKFENSLRLAEALVSAEDDHETRVIRERGMARNRLPSNTAPAPVSRGQSSTMDKAKGKRTASQGVQKIIGNARIVKKTFARGACTTKPCKDDERWTAVSASNGEPKSTSTVCFQDLLAALSKGNAGPVPLLTEMEIMRLLSELPNDPFTDDAAD